MNNTFKEKKDMCFELKLTIQFSSMSMTIRTDFYAYLPIRWLIHWSNLSPVVTFSRVVDSKPNLAFMEPPPRASFCGGPQYRVGNSSIWNRSHKTLLDCSKNTKKNNNITEGMWPYFLGTSNARHSMDQIGNCLIWLASATINHANCQISHQGWHAKIIGGESEGSPSL